MTTKTDNSNITNNIPSEELWESLNEIEDYKNRDIELDTYEDAKEMRVSLRDD